MIVAVAEGGFRDKKWIGIWAHLFQEEQIKV
jgi:hypothetical protein